MNPFVFFVLLFKASLLSSGGMGPLPLLHNDLIARRWATEQQFVESLAIGQVSPGPSGLWVLCLGYFADGLRGSLLALVAINLPPFFILLVEKMYYRIRHIPAVEGFVQGLSLAVVGIFAVVLARLLSQSGIRPGTVAVASVSAALAASKRVSVVAILALAAVAGILLNP